MSNVLAGPERWHTLFCSLESGDNTCICLQNALPENTQVVLKLVVKLRGRVGQSLPSGLETCTYWIGGDASRLTEDIHCVVKVIFERRANGQSNIAEAFQNRYFGVTV